MKKIIIATVVLLFSYCTTQAQQDPQYTQYMYNQAVINPAYAGSTDNLSITTLYRNQWTGFDGAPKTITFSGHSPIGKKTGLGLSFISDQHGPVKENNIYADFSYTIDVGENNKLAFGLKGGVTLHNIGLFTEVVTVDPDEAFSEDVSEATPNAGIGAFFYSEKYYVGLSLPNMLRSAHLDANGTKYGSEELHYFLTAGYVFQLTENTKFKPSFLVKSELESALSFDVNANFLFYDKFEIGASYRNEDSFSGLVGFAFSENIRMGYAYDHILTDINMEAKASHEVFLQFDLNFPKKVSRSPRFF
jgi:type IX secretion system PorP/SprF family membrane protein